MPRTICLIANRKSGQNSRDREVISRAMEALGDGTIRLDWSPGQPIADVVTKALSHDPDFVVAAGGDGTIMAVAGALLGRGVPMGVLPLGTFNFFARGLGLSEVPEDAAVQLLTGTPHEIRIGMVNGRAFLNNASLGVYPSILKERETVYSRWGRFRMAAHWSVLKVFLRFRKPMKVTITTDEGSRTRRTPLVFVARSSYQLDFFGIDGTEAIDTDRFAVLIARAESRRGLLAMTMRLIMRRPVRGRDYDLISTATLRVETSRKRSLVAFDGEKARLAGPFEFRMSDRPLTIILPHAERTE